MPMPAVVARTFEMFKEDASFRKLLKQMGRKLTKISDPKKRAQFTHKKIEEELEKQFKDPIVSELVQCKKGCSACCHTQVSVTIEEAEILAEKVKDGLPIDWTKLFIQSGAGTSASSFYSIPHEMRGCIFLGDEGECRVYNDRPSVCRTNHVLSDPSQCEIKDIQGKEAPSVQLLNTYAADTWVYTLFKNSPKTGTLPQLVKSILSQFSAGKMSDTEKDA